MLVQKTNKQKSKKWIIISGVAVIALITIFVMISSLNGKVTESFNKITTTKGSIKTYYTFSGNVESKNTQLLMAERIMQISEVKVSEGEKVEKDTVLFTTSDGSEIKSKIDGTVSKIHVDENMQIMAGANLCNIYDFDNLQVTVKVDEYDLNCVAVDKKIDITMGALDKTVTGTITKISDTAVNQNGITYFTATVDLEKDNSIKVGMTAEAKILNKQANDVILLPLTAIQFDENNNPYVYIMENDNKNSKPIKKTIELGINDSKNAEVKKGLSKGQTVLYPKSIDSSKDKKFMPPMAPKSGI